MRSKQLEIWLFSYAYNLWTTRLDNFEEKITFARHAYGQVGFFRIEIIISDVQPLKKYQFSNNFHLIASHCTKAFFEDLCMEPGAGILSSSIVDNFAQTDSFQYYNF